VQPEPYFLKGLNWQVRSIHPVVNKRLTLAPAQLPDGDGMGRICFRENRTILVEEAGNWVRGKGYCGTSQILVKI
jgi:hypothetical protein